MNLPKIYFSCSRPAYSLAYFEAEIVEMTFVVSRFSDIRKEKTSFLVVSKRDDRTLCSFSVVSARKDYKQNFYWLKVGVGGKGWMGVGRYWQVGAQEVGSWVMRIIQAKQERLFIRLFMFPFIVSPSQLQKQKSAPRND